MDKLKRMRSTMYMDIHMCDNDAGNAWCKRCDHDPTMQFLGYIRCEAPLRRSILCRAYWLKVAKERLNDCI